MLDLDTIFRLSSHTGKVQRHFKTGFKIFMKVIAVLVVLITILIIGSIYWDDIELQYYKIIWKPELIFDELSTEMTRSDVYFIKGEPDDCTDDKTVCAWELKYGVFLGVRFESDNVSTISKIFKEPLIKSP